MKTRPFTYTNCRLPRRRLPITSVLHSHSNK